MQARSLAAHMQARAAAASPPPGAGSSKYLWAVVLGWAVSVGVLAITAAALHSAASASGAAGKRAAGARAALRRGDPHALLPDRVAGAAAIVGGDGAGDDGSVTLQKSGDRGLLQRMRELDAQAARPRAGTAAAPASVGEAATVATPAQPMGATTSASTRRYRPALADATDVPPAAVSSGQEDPSLLFIAIGVAPHYYERRTALRETWLRWCAEAPDCGYVFFTEHPTAGSRHYTEDASERLTAEADAYGDMVFQEGASGYGKENGRRELFHIQWALDNRGAWHYYLRVDDDGFLCLRQLLEELRYHHDHTRPLLHGRYHCHAAKARMDENYLLMSRDLAAVLAAGFGRGRLPFEPRLTFALNLGNIVPTLVSHGRLHVFDDQKRICWPYSAKGVEHPCHLAWRGELKKRPGPFCDNFLWSHWVKNASSLRQIYDAQVGDAGSDTSRPRGTEAERRANTTRVQRFYELLSTPVCDRWPGFAGGVIPFYRAPHQVLGPKWGIPGMRPLANDTVLRGELETNVTALFAACGGGAACWAGGGGGAAGSS